jgi:hypothetical protein
MENNIPLPENQIVFEQDEETLAGSPDSNAVDYRQQIINLFN